MNFLEAAGFGLLQGATELFPVSSLGHAVVLPALLGSGVDLQSDTFLPFLVLLHLGTAAALLILYRGEWARLITGFVRAAARGRLETADERTAMLVVIATVPAGVIALVLEHPIRLLFRSPRVAAALLVVNGGVLLVAELLRRRAERRADLGRASRPDQERAAASIGQLGFARALLIGSAQAFALLPGISRSGVTMAGGLVAGLSHEEAAHLSFLLATPIIAAAGLLEVPQLFSAGVPLAAYTVGAVVAGLAAYASARFLLRYFRSGRLDPYAGYCALAGVLGLILLR